MSLTYFEVCYILMYIGSTTAVRVPLVIRKRIPQDSGLVGNWELEEPQLLSSFVKTLSCLFIY
jgi:hypothetical protein